METMTAAKLTSRQENVAQLLANSLWASRTENVADYMKDTAERANIRAGSVLEVIEVAFTEEVGQAIINRAYELDDARMSSW